MRIVGEVKPGRIWYVLSVIRLHKGSSSKQLYSTVEGCIRSPPAVFGSHGNL